MSEWLAIAEWQRCAEMARPGIVFEIRNSGGQSLFAPCATELPEKPFDWSLPPTEFRSVVAKPAQHSTPIPAPRG